MAVEIISDIIDIPMNERSVLVSQEEEAYRRTMIMKALGVPEEYIYGKPKPKLLTRFQILKNNE